MDAIITIIITVGLAVYRKKEAPTLAALPVWKTGGDGGKNEGAFTRLYNAIMGGEDVV